MKNDDYASQLRMTLCQHSHEFVSENKCVSLTQIRYCKSFTICSQLKPFRIHTKPFWVGILKMFMNRRLWSDTIVNYYHWTYWTKI